MYKREVATDPASPSANCFSMGDDEEGDELDYQSPQSTPPRPKKEPVPLTAAEQESLALAQHRIAGLTKGDEVIFDADEGSLAFRVNDEAPVRVPDLVWPPDYDPDDSDSEEDESLESDDDEIMSDAESDASSAPDLVERGDSSDDDSLQDEGEDELSEPPGSDEDGDALSDFGGESGADDGGSLESDSGGQAGVAAPPTESLDSPPVSAL